MTGTYCDVAVPVPLYDTFTYRIPDSLAGKIAAGSRVVVPFGARKLVGVVTALPTHPLAGVELKDVAEVVDAKPVLPPSLLALARWVSEYYAAPIGEVFRAMLPLHGEFAHSEKARLTEAGETRLAELEEKQERNAAEESDYQALHLFVRRKERTVSGLVKKLGQEGRVVARMRRQGWIEIVRDVRRKKRRVAAAEPLPLEEDWALGTPHTLTGEQQQALTEIEGMLAAREFATVLLHGVTGSGKTEVYSRAIETCLAAGRTAILLVPEIALTPAVAGQFVARFGEQVAVLHSGLRPGERSAEWWRLRRGEARVAVGTRSAVFAPVENVGVIIVDEEQDASYKQGETPRYHGRDTAVVRAKQAGAVAVLGTATPSLETAYQARSGRYRLLAMGRRVGNRELARVDLVDMRMEFQQTGKAALLSRALVSGLQEALAAGGQALVLRNRRGYANYMLCRKCGVAVQCVNCSISLTYHRQRQRLLCHYCGYGRAVPRKCEKCESEHLYLVGEGTEKVEEAVRRVLPGAQVARLDRDTAAGRHGAETMLRRFVRGELDVLVGTQMIAKGHDFQNVTLVGVVSADGVLGLPDFRAAERTFQLLTQVAGRAGRGRRPGRVLVQTFYPDHYAIRLGAAQDYDGFYEQELLFRQRLYYPPFVALANVVVRDRKLDAAIRAARALQQFFEAAPAKSLRVLGPAPAPIARLKQEHRFQFLIKSSDRGALQKFLREMAAFARQKEIAPNALLVDVDPLSLM